MEGETPFSKNGGLTGSQFLEEAAWKEGVDIFQGGGVLTKKQKKNSKSDIFNDKKSLLTLIFFTALTKNLNWEILTKNSDIFKTRWG